MGFEWCLCGESSRKSTRCTPGGVKDGRPRAAATGKTRSGWGDSRGAGGCARTSGRRAGRHARGAMLTWSQGLWCKLKPTVKSVRASASLSRVVANGAQAASAAFHSSVIVALHPPSLPVLNCLSLSETPFYLRRWQLSDVDPVVRSTFQSVFNVPRTR